MPAHAHPLPACLSSVSPTPSPLATAVPWPPLGPSGVSAASVLAGHAWKSAWAPMQASAQHVLRPCRPDPWGGTHWRIALRGPRGPCEALGPGQGTSSCLEVWCCRTPSRHSQRVGLLGTRFPLPTFQPLLCLQSQEGFPLSCYLALSPLGLMCLGGHRKVVMPEPRAGPEIAGTGEGNGAELNSEKGAELSYLS